MSPTSKRDVGRLLRAHYRVERGAPDAAAKAATLKACLLYTSACGAGGADAAGGTR